MRRRMSALIIAALAFPFTEPALPREQQWSGRPPPVMSLDDDCEEHNLWPEALKIDCGGARATGTAGRMKSPRPREACCDGMAFGNAARRL